MSPLRKIFGLSLIVVAAGVAAQGIASIKPNAESIELKAQIGELQSRLSALESRVDAMNKARMHKAAP